MLSPLWEPDFSEHSYGFREGRSAHEAIHAAKKYIQAGRTFVVDLDLEKFFDRVQHDVLEKPAWRGRKFLGYSFAPGKTARMKVAPESVARLKEKVRERMRMGRGRNLARQIEESLTPLLRGWVNYFRLAEVKNIFEELDGWIRRKLRATQWRQWKHVFTRAKNLMRLGLEKGRALKSAMNGRGPWWNAGASHMNAALPKKYFDRLGLVSLVDQRLKFR